MQGQLRGEALTFFIETECKHCGESFQIEIDSNLAYTVHPAGAQPIIFAPMVDFSRLEDPSIIDAF